MKTAIISVPRLEPHRPPPGPATVASICAGHGHEVVAYDLNIKFYGWCHKHSIDYYGYDPVFSQVAEPVPEQEQYIDQFTKHWVDVISREHWDYVMISVFGSSGTWYAERFLKALRPCVSAKIVAGGMAVGSNSLLDGDRCFGQYLRESGLIDDFIVGEAEKTLISYLQNKSGPGINNTELVQIDDLEGLPNPDYGFYDLDEYDYLAPGQREIYITGSRGCVRKCSYCDVERYWPKYRFRSGRSISDEIIENYERHGITRFYFTDSLVNGSFKMFNDMCEKLAAYRFQVPISWSGQFIFRQRRTIPRDHFATISAAGGRLFFVGVETGSDSVRRDMGKDFTNEDADWQFEQCSRHGINIIPLMFTGYITETLQDHQDNLDCFRRWQRWVADGTITGVELGSMLIVLPGAPVERMIESHGLEFMLTNSGDPAQQLWYARSNPDLTVRERIRRKIEVHRTAIQHAWPVWRQSARLKEFLAMVEQNKLWRQDHQFYHLIKDSEQPRRRSVIPISAAQYE